MKKHLAIFGAAALFVLLSAAPAEAQTRKETKLYHKIMNPGTSEQGAGKRVAKLQNEELLAKIALGTRYSAISNLATGKIHSQKYLIEIAKVVPYRNVKESAIKRIENEEDRLDVFLNLDMAYRGLIPHDMAVKLIGRADFDVESKRMLIKERIENIDNQDLLYKLLSDDALADTHVIVVGKLTDQALLTEVVKNRGNTDIARNAIRRIEDQNALADIAKTHRTQSIASMAISRLTDQNLLWEVITSEQERTSGPIDSNMPPETIASIDKTRKQTLRKEAVKRITDQGLLVRLVEEFDDPEIGNGAFGKLDAASLEMLAATRPTGDPMGVAARVVTKKTDWSAEINNSRQPIGSVINAMALVPKEVKPTVDNIVAACHKYIRRGDESRIPDLEFLLNNYGDMRLAEDYLNCGNRRLYDIGAAWARRNGYYIGSGWGSNRATWGSGR